MKINCNSSFSDKKHARLGSILKEHNPDVLCACETKLDSSISNSAIVPPDAGYDIVNR